MSILFNYWKYVIVYVKKNQDHCTKKFRLDLFVVGHVVFNSIGTLFDIPKVVKVVKTLSNIEFTKPPNLESKNRSIIFCTISINTTTW